MSSTRSRSRGAKSTAKVLPVACASGWGAKGWCLNEREPIEHACMECKAGLHIACCYNNVNRLYCDKHKHLLQQKINDKHNLLVVALMNLWLFKSTFLFCPLLRGS
jgi:hypothetical protein